ncbi:MAG: acylhydrolase, partial [Rhodothermales bacterium]|nr:acylhydrolase [Rhodothermales bacterium]
MRNLLLLLLSMAVTEFAGAQDWANLDRYQTANAALAGVPADGRVVFMGDSITEGWDLEAAFPGRPYVNRGISGQTTPQMLVRFRQDVVSLAPEFVIILAGTNDIAGNTGPATLEEIAGNIASMAEIARANGIVPIIASVLPARDYPWRPGLGPDVKIPQLNAMLADYAKSRGFPWLDYFTAMTDGENGLRPELTNDGVHVTSVGYLVMATLVDEILDVL